MVIIILHTFSLRPSRHIASHDTGCAIISDLTLLLLVSANVESTLLHFIFDVTLYTNALNLYEYNSKYLPDSQYCYRVNRDCVFRCPRSKFCLSLTPNICSQTVLECATNWDDLGKNNFLHHLSCAGVLGGLLILGSVLVNSVAPLFVPKNQYKTVQFSRN